MAVTTSALWNLTTALLAKFNADTTLAANNVLIIDGPVLLDESRQNILFVGGSPSDKDMTTPDGTFTQAWGELGARARYEDLTVNCELWVRDGSTDLSARRATAQALLSAIESALRTDFTLSDARLMWCEVRTGVLYQIQANTGSAVKVPFTIAARARLASQ